MTEIVLECKPDETLIRTLGYAKKRVVHEPSKARVLNYLEKNEMSVGMVDEDPGAANAGYFLKYTKQGMHKYDIDYFVVPNKATRLIVLKPRLEEWVLKQAKSTSIKPADFGLPDSGSRLHKVINEELPKFKNMLEAILSKDGSALLCLKNLIDGKIGK